MAARTKIKVTTLSKDAGVAKPTATNVDQANGMYLAAADLYNETVPAVYGPRHLMLEVFNTDTSDHAITIKAGVNPPAGRQGLGDLSITVSHSSTVPFLIGPLSSSRFVQADGTINVDFAASFAGTIQGYILNDRS